MQGVDGVRRSVMWNDVSISAGDDVMRVNRVHKQCDVCDLV